MLDDNFCPAGFPYPELVNKSLATTLVPQISRKLIMAAVQFIQWELAQPLDCMKTRGQDDALLAAKVEQVSS